MACMHLPEVTCPECRAGMGIPLFPSVFSPPGPPPVFVGPEAMLLARIEKLAMRVGQSEGALRWILKRLDDAHDHTALLIKAACEAALSESEGSKP